MIDSGDIAYILFECEIYNYLIIYVIIIIYWASNITSIQSQEDITKNYVVSQP